MMHDSLLNFHSVFLNTLYRPIALTSQIGLQKEGITIEKKFECQLFCVLYQIYTAISIKVVPRAKWKSRIRARKNRIKISNRRATQRCAKICSLLARRQNSQPVQRVYWPGNVIDWLGKWRPTCVMRHARGQKLQSFRRKWPFYMIFILWRKAAGNR